MECRNQLSSDEASSAGCCCQAARWVPWAWISGHDACVAEIDTRGSIPASHWRDENERKGRAEFSQKTQS